MLRLPLCVGAATRAGASTKCGGKGSRNRQEQDAMIPPHNRKCLLLWPTCHLALLDRAFVCPCCRALSSPRNRGCDSKVYWDRRAPAPPLSARRANGRVQLKVKQSKNSHCWAPFGMCSLCSLLMPMALTDARDAQHLFLIQDCCSSGRSQPHGPPLAGRYLFWTEARHTCTK